MQFHLVRLAGFALGAIIGLVTCMALVSMAMGISIWLHGDSMLSLVYGLVTLSLGSIPYYLVVIGIFTLFRIKLTLTISTATGFGLGMIFPLTAPIIGSYLKDLTFWSRFDNVSQVQIGLGLVGLLGVIVTTLIAALIVMLIAPKGQPRVDHGC